MRSGIKKGGRAHGKYLRGAQALFVCLGLVLVRATSAADTKTGLSVHFEQVGQVCVSTEESAKLRQALPRLPKDGAHPVTLIAYSDQVEMRMASWHDGVDCIKTPIPALLVNHERIAWLRAVALIEELRTLHAPAFFRQPRLVIGPDSSYINQDGNDLVVIVQRSRGSGPDERRVEIVWSEHQTDASSVAPATDTLACEHVAPLVRPAQTGGQFAPFDTHSGPNRSGAQRTVGSLLLAGGVAAVLQGAGFIGAGAYYNVQRLKQYDEGARTRAEALAQPMWHTGGWSLGLGLGLSAAGAILLLGSRPVQGKRQVTESSKSESESQPVTKTTTERIGPCVHVHGAHVSGPA